MPADDGDMVGDFIGWDYVDYTNLWTDAEGPMDGAFSTQGLITIGDSNIDITIDSTNVTHSVDVDGTLAIDEVTLLVDASDSVSFEHAFSVTDAVLDPDPSVGGNDDAPVNVAWAIIEAAVPGKFHLDKLASSSGTIVYDPFEYFSNTAFYFDSSSMGDIVSTVNFFDEDLLFSEAGISGSCVTVYEMIDTDVQCLPLYTSRSVETAELLITNVAVDSPLMTAGAAYTTQELCEGSGNGWGCDVDPALSCICLPASFTDAVANEYPLTIPAPEYALSDSYTVENDGVGADKTTADYLTAMFDRDEGATGNDNLIDVSEDCTDGSRALVQNIVFFGDPSVLTAGCAEVWKRFIDAPGDVLPANIDDMVLNGHFSVNFVDRTTSVYPWDYNYLQIFFNDYDINTSHIQDGILGSIPYGEKMLYRDAACIVDRQCSGDDWGHEASVWGADTVADGVYNILGPQIVYARDQVTYGDMKIEVGWIDQAIEKKGGDLLDNDFNVKLEITADEPGGDCTGFGLWGNVVGSTALTSDGCTAIPQYGKEHAYMCEHGGDEAVVGTIEQLENACRTLIMGNNNMAGYYDALDWRDEVVTQTENEKTLRDKIGYCLNFPFSSNLVAKPNVRNAQDITWDASITETCQNVLQRFVNIDLDTVTFGEDIVLPAHNIRIEYPGAGGSTQGVKALILDGTDVPTPSVYEDILTGAYSQGEYEGVPANALNPTVNHWFDVDQRVTAGINERAAAGTGGSGNLMSIYTTGGTADTPAPLDAGNWVKVAASFDFYRVRESDQMQNVPENVYLMSLSLQNPIDSDGNMSAESCNFEQIFVIYGSCECNLDDSCEDFAWE